MFHSCNSRFKLEADGKQSQLSGLTSRFQLVDVSEMLLAPIPVDRTCWVSVGCVANQGVSEQEL
jgi:hypothetical protein